MSWLSKLKQGLSKTASLFSFSSVDKAGLEETEEALLCADVGYRMTAGIMDELKAAKPATSDELRQKLKEILIEKVSPVAMPLKIDTSRHPFIILMIGVNGAGKTTTIGKLGEFYQHQGYRVAFVAGDTFRAGATEQLCRWAERLKCPVYQAEKGSDAAGLVFDAICKSKKNGDDILFIDTAGRLQNRSDLMDELKKINRVIQKQDPTAPHATLLVLDATVGQNALSQVSAFKDMVGITGLIMTKLDGTAKGGILIALADQFKLPVHALGVGEQADDLQPFTAEEYVSSLIGESK